MGAEKHTRPLKSHFWTYRADLGEGLELLPFNQRKLKDEVHEMLETRVEMRLGSQRNDLFNMRVVPAHAPRAHIRFAPNNEQADRKGVTPEGTCARRFGRAA